ncbi:MAG: DUF151 domain-containing protein [Candidatus Aenigmatarchaeota archaeon]
MNKTQITVLIALAISLISLLLALLQKEEFIDLTKLIQTIPSLSTYGYSKVEKVEVSFSPAAIALYANCYRLVGYVEDAQAKSIYNALNKIRDWRPNTHDVTIDIFKEFNIKIIDVRIENITNNAYIAKIFIAQGNKIRELDIRPSDGIALALRYDAPIYIRNELLENNGEKVC